MKRDYTLIQLIGFSITAIMGTLLHFVYEWTDNNLLAATVSGVNESVWEHMKLLFFPLFLVALLQRKLFKNRRDFWCIKLLGTVTGLMLIPILYYTYNGAFGKSPDWLNISIFFIAAALVFWLENRLFQKKKGGCFCSTFCFWSICFIGILFVIFTFSPPKLPLFLDPVTQTYGL